MSNDVLICTAKLYNTWAQLREEHAAMTEARCYAVI
jgi:hypothetical protein